MACLAKYLIWGEKKCGALTEFQCIRAGNVWIYSTFGKFTTTPGETTYCHPTLYWYAFWITTAGYILLGVVLVVGCIIVCCVDLGGAAVKSDTQPVYERY